MVTSVTVGGTSSSVTETMKLSATSEYSLDVAVAATWFTTTLSLSPSESVTALTVTVWGVFQFIVVNVSVFWVPFAEFPSVSSTVTARVSELVMVAVTFWVGWPAKRTV